MPRDAWLSLIDAWNRIATREPTWTAVATRLQRQSQGRLLRALQVLPDLDAWEARFARASASDHLTNRNGKGFVATLWWLLEHVDELDAGQYDNRVKTSSVAAAEPDLSWAAEVFPEEYAAQQAAKGRAS